MLGLCQELGFGLAGIADAAPTRWGAELRAWLAAGKQGAMGYLAEHVAARLDPGLVLPGARSAIMVADFYARRGDADGPLPRGWGRIARYARGRDYHRVIKKRLHVLCDRLRAAHPQAGFRAVTDTAPVLEREYAARAGLGWIGKHTLLIHPRHGSWMLLGGVLTTLILRERPGASKSSEQDFDGTVPDHCGTCTRCIDACPTRAITPYSVDASRCISYLTIERRGAVDPAFSGLMGDWLFGCDVCQEVCPHNSPRPAGSDDPPAVRPEYAPRRSGFDLLAVLGWTEADRREAFASSALKRATLAMMKRNALIVAGNLLATTPALADRARELAADATEPELVRATAREVLARAGVK